ncbi:AMP-binding protein [Actinophytocola sp.]|uniref:AMP-binding protein n=1 Tax=Actinophytocola sp. TaxID=1872138 RepID=UPI002ED38859
MFPSFAAVVAARAESRPDDELVRLVGSPGWTAAMLWERSMAIAGGLAGLVGVGNAVATCLPAGPEAIAVTTALSALGAVELPLDPEVDGRWAQTLARSAGCVTTVTTPDALRDRPFLGLLGSHPSVPVIVSLDELANSGRPVGLRRLDPGEPALVMTTSGTTGQVKGALLPVAAGPGQAARVQRAMRYDATDVLYNFFPWHHINARHAGFLPAVISGARLVIDRRFSASRFLDVVRAEGVTAFNFMGAVCAILLRQPPSAHDRNHLVRRAYGGPAPAPMVAAMAQRFGITLHQAYACTELGDVSTTHLGDVRPGAAGRPVPEYQLQVVDGELLVRPTRPHLTFLEYVGDPEATARAWGDGWFRTGDRVRLDDGWLYFECRSADVVRRRGVNISPDSVEEVIATLPGVSEVAVVGVPSELTEDEVLAVVVPESSVDPVDVWWHCRERLPRFAVPRFVSIQDSLPRNGNLKISRATLRTRGLPADAWDADKETM